MPPYGLGPGTPGRAAHPSPQVRERGACPTAGNCDPLRDVARAMRHAPDATKVSVRRITSNHPLGATNQHNPWLRPVRATSVLRTPEETRATVVAMSLHVSWVGGVWFISSPDGAVHAAGDGRWLDEWLATVGATRKDLDFSGSRALEQRFVSEFGPI